MTWGRRLVVGAVLAVVALSSACSDDGGSPGSDRAATSDPAASSGGSGGSGDAGDGTSGAPGTDGTSGPAGAHPIQFRLVQQDAASCAGTSQTYDGCTDEQRAQLDAATCPAPARWVPPSEPMVGCVETRDSDAGAPEPLLLGPAQIVGGVLDAQAGVPQGAVQHVVTLQLDHAGAKEFERISRRLVNTQQQVAVVVEGQIVTAPAIAGVIGGGRIQISGDFGEREAQRLARQIAAGG